MEEKVISLNSWCGLKLRHGYVKEPFTKRVFDFLLALLGLIISSLLWILIAFAIWIEDGFPIFYTQYRVGRKGRIFRLLKFRSMIKDAEKMTGAVWAFENDQRVTKIGRILRNTAMDELPQLLNILKGDISFVGPRAERPELVEKFKRILPKYELRNSIRPGLTGLAQIYGKYDSHPRQKLRFDLLYIKNLSFWLDIKLIILSFWITFRGKWESRSKKL